MDYGAPGTGIISTQFVIIFFIFEVFNSKNGLKIKDCYILE